MLRQVALDQFGHRLGVSITQSAKLVDHAFPVDGGLVLADFPFAAPGSNLDFDTSLRERNPEWGLRRLETLAAAAAADFGGPQVIEMPANNVTLVLRRR